MDRPRHTSKITQSHRTLLGTAQSLIVQMRNIGALSGSWLIAVSAQPWVVSLLLGILTFRMVTRAVAHSVSSSLATA